MKERQGTEKVIALNKKQDAA